MGLPKGRTNNAKGRPPGRKNRKTSELKELVKSFLEQKWSEFEKDFQKLDPKDRIQIFERMLKYVVPSLQSAKAEINLRNLSDEDLDLMIKKIIENETT